MSKKFEIHFFGRRSVSPSVNQTESVTVSVSDLLPVVKKSTAVKSDYTNAVTTVHTAIKKERDTERKRE